MRTPATPYLRVDVAAAAPQHRPGGGRGPASAGWRCARTSRRTRRWRSRGCSWRPGRSASPWPRWARPRRSCARASTTCSWPTRSGSTTPRPAGCATSRRTRRVAIGVDSVEGAGHSGLLLGAVGRRGAGRGGLRPPPHRRARPSGPERSRWPRGRSGLEVRGVFTFPGHSYAPDATRTAAARRGRRPGRGGRDLRRVGIEPAGGQRRLHAHPGGQPADAGVLTELRPGVYVFGDAQQWELGTTTPDRIALTCRATVVSHAGGRLVLDAGSKVLGADRAAYATGFGRLLDLPRRPRRAALGAPRRRGPGRCSAPPAGQPVRRRAQPRLRRGEPGRRAVTPRSPAELRAWPVAARGLQRLRASAPYDAAMRTRPLTCPRAAWWRSPPPWPAAPATTAPRGHRHGRHAASTRTADGPACTFANDGPARRKEVDPPPDRAHRQRRGRRSPSRPARVTSRRPWTPEAAPCTVNSFVSLADQGYFDDTPCHRLTTQGIFVLQCGDPTGTGAGGPGYSFADELAGSETYGPARSRWPTPAPGTNGSQFFLVYGDCRCRRRTPCSARRRRRPGGRRGDRRRRAPPTATPGDGAPRSDVTISSVTVELISSHSSST